MNYEEAKASLAFLLNNCKKEDLFKLLWSSEFVTKGLFSKSLASCKHRKREAQSPIYAEFMQWVNNQSEKSDALYIPQDEVERNIFYEEVFGKDLMDKVLKEHYYRLHMKEHKAKIYAEHFDSIKFLKLLYEFGFEDNLKPHYANGHAPDDIYELYNYDMEIKKLYGKFRSDVDVMNINQLEIKNELKQFIKNNQKLIK